MSSILPLRLTDLAVTKRGTPIIGPISLELSGDGTTAILGPNGAGKTTLLRAMHGLERLSAGTIEWQLPREEAETRQAYVFQTPIIMRRSVVDNIAYPLMVRGRSKAEARAKATVKAEQVGLAAALQ
ncbi:MAG: ATP-binding cassette domain-containing protein, partial [Pseudomonadota bacterium]